MSRCRQEAFVAALSTGEGGNDRDTKDQDPRRAEERRLIGPCAMQQRRSRRIRQLRPPCHSRCMCMCRSAFAAAATVISTPTRHSTSGRALRAQTMRRWPFARCGSCMNGSWHMVWWSRLHPPFSSAGARRRCYLPAIWWRCWTPCARYGAFVRMPRSQPRRIPTRSIPGICAY